MTPEDTHEDFQLKGVYTAALTPLTADLGADLDLLAGHGRWLLDNGCDGLAVLGPAGGHGDRAVLRVLDRFAGERGGLHELRLALQADIEIARICAHIGEGDGDLACEGGGGEGCPGKRRGSENGHANHDRLLCFYMYFKS